MYNLIINDSGENLVIYNKKYHFAYFHSKSANFFVKAH